MRGRGCTAPHSRCPPHVAASPDTALGGRPAAPLYRRKGGVPGMAVLVRGPWAVHGLPFLALSDAARGVRRSETDGACPFPPSTGQGSSSDLPARTPDREPPPSRAGQSLSGQRLQQQEKSQDDTWTLLALGSFSFRLSRWPLAAGARESPFTGGPRPDLLIAFYGRLVKMSFKEP